MAPDFLPHPLVQALGEGLGEAIGDGLEQDRRVVVVVGLEGHDPVLGTDPARDGEAPDVVGQPRRLGRHEIGQRPIRYAVAVLSLLPQRADGGDDLRTGLIGIHLDVVADRIGGEEPDDTVGGEPFVGDDLLEHHLRIVEQLARGLTHARGVEDIGVAPLDLPGREEGCPVDVVAQVLEGVVEELGDARREGCRRNARGPIDRRGVRPCVVQGDEWALGRLGGVSCPQRVVVALDGAHEGLALLRVEQLAGDRDRP